MPSVILVRQAQSERPVCGLAGGWPDDPWPGWGEHKPRALQLDRPLSIELVQFHRIVVQQLVDQIKRRLFAEIVTAHLGLQHIHQT